MARPACRIGRLAFTTRNDDLGARSTTTASAGWSPTGWTAVGEAGPTQRTSYLSVILQEIVDRPGWRAGHAAVMLVSGSGVRVAEAFDGSVPNAPTLVARYLP